MQVTKPVTETSTIEEKYTVMVPVKKQEVIDQSYYKTDYVTETPSARKRTPVFDRSLKTQYQTQNVVVPRTVTENAVPNTTTRHLFAGDDLSNGNR